MKIDAQGLPLPTKKARLLVLLLWWLGGDLNSRPRAYESPALPLSYPALFGEPNILARHPDRQALNQYRLTGLFVAAQFKYGNLGAYTQSDGQGSDSQAASDVDGKSTRANHPT